MEEVRTYKGIDLLNKILEFVAMTPDSKHWTYNALKHNQPRLIRLKQINSLISAFILDSKNDNLVVKLKELFSSDKIDLQIVLNGDFLENRNIIDYSEFINLVKKDTKNSNLTDSWIDFSDLKNVFLIFVSYKKNIRNLLEFNSGWFEVSRMSSIFSIKLTNSITSNLIGKYDELDEALELLINPKKLSFTETELISKFNFPKENLDDIDLENW